MTVSEWLFFIMWHLNMLGPTAAHALYWCLFLVIWTWV